MIDIIKIICTIVGTFIGAGFASGKEIYLFFYRYGISGMLGIIISSALVGFVIYKAILISKNNGFNNYDEFLNFIIKNKYIKIIIKNIINIFLIISFCVMISGFCSFMKQEFNLNFIISYIIIMFFCLAIFKRNVSGIIKINNILIPVIIVVILIIASNKIDFSIFNENNNLKNNGFLISSILYSNYNLLTIIPIIITVSTQIKNKKNIKYISIITVLILIFLSFAIFFVLATGDNNLLNLDMPLVAIAGKSGIIYKYIYSIVVGTAIFTTAISVGYSYMQKFEKNEKLYNKQIRMLIFFTILSISIGFSKLIEILYPLFGVIGVLQSYFIIKLNSYTKFKNKTSLGK